jgi:glycosyltransferase involved in cell wall biosynthesis
MNYIYLIPGKKFGDVELQTIKFALATKERGHKVIIVCNNNSPVHHYANKLNLQTEFIHVTYPYIDIFSAFELSLICNKYEIDVCVVVKTKFLAISLSASKMSKQNPKIFLYQQLRSDVNKKDFYHNILYQRLSGAVVLTDRMRNDLLRNTIINPDIVKVIPYGIDYKRYHPDNFDKKTVREMFGLPQDKFIIGNIARIHKTQDQLSIIRAFHNANLPDAVLGLCFTDQEPDSKYHLKIVQEVEALQLLDKVIFLPCTQQVAELMNCFDMYVLASRSVTFSLSVIEAIAAGLPVIAFNNGGIQEIIKHNYNGFLVVRSDIDSMEHYMKEIFNNHDIARKFRDINLRLVQHKYDFAKQVDTFLEFVK